MAKRRSRQIPYIEYEQNRCPICRKVIDPHDRNHVKDCLAKHRLSACQFCGRFISIDNINQHIAALHTRPQRIERNPDNDISLDDFSLSGAKKLSWQILPQGLHRFQAIIDYFEEFNQRKQLSHLFERQRLDDVYELGADEIYVGADEFDGYVVFVFLTRDMAVLESPYYGNATYIMWGSWRRLSRLTKGTLLSQHNQQVMRLIHKERWLFNLKTLFR